MKHEQASSRRDHLTVTTEEGKIELTEEQLARVSGGDMWKWMPTTTILPDTTVKWSF